MTATIADPTRPVRTTAPRPLRLTSESTALACVSHAKPEAVALLSQVLARLHGLDIPVVQFIQVSKQERPASIARDFAEASLTRLGRTLLASLHEPDIGAATGRGDEGSHTAGRRRTRKISNDVPDIIPDAALHGLYHTRIGAVSAEINQIAHVPPAVWLGEARLDFRLLIIDCGPLERNPAAAELASRCHGSILTVLAGCTLLSEVRSAATQVQVAGGTLLGSVLYNAVASPSSASSKWMPHLTNLIGHMRPFQKAR